MKTNDTVSFAYKVVSVESLSSGRKGFGSAIIRSTEPLKQTTYTLNRVAKPKKGANPFLFVFESQAQARRFAAGRANKAIIKGIAIGLSKEAKGTDGANYAARAFPAGTTFAEKFVPLEVVEYTKAY